VVALGLMRAVQQCSKGVFTLPSHELQIVGR
jgi:hypothetical protein